jgi:hypothetical protein
MICPKCESNSVSVVPAEIRLYRSTSRILSHPPLTPSPDIQVCLDCGWSEFAIPRSYLSAGWLRPLRPQAVPNAPSIGPSIGHAKIAIAS